MPWASTVPFNIWFVSTLIFTVFFWLRWPKQTAVAALIWIDYALYQLFWFLTLNWLFPNYYLRLLPIALPFALLLYWRRRLEPNPIVGRPRAPLWPDQHPLTRVWLIGGGLVLAALVYFNVRVLLSYRQDSPSGEKVLLLTPVRIGAYVVVNGGNARQGWGMNDHWNALPWTENPPDEQEAYAVDFVEFNTSGTMMTSLIRGSRQSYQGYMDQIYAPCPGAVVKIVDGYPEALPPAPGETELGNYLVLQCNKFYVTIGGFKNESFNVKEGDQVRFSTQLGMVGASGNPSIPHVHVHATVNGLTGEPVPILFDGIFAVDQFAVRNQIFIPQN